MKIEEGFSDKCLTDEDLTFREPKSNIKKQFELSIHIFSWKLIPMKIANVNSKYKIYEWLFITFTIIKYNKQ